MALCMAPPWSAGSAIVAPCLSSEPMVPITPCCTTLAKAAVTGDRHALASWRVLTARCSVQRHWAEAESGPCSNSARMAQGTRCFLTSVTMGELRLPAWFEVEMVCYTGQPLLEVQVMGLSLG